MVRDGQGEAKNVSMDSARDRDTDQRQRSETETRGTDQRQRQGDTLLCRLFVAAASVATCNCHTAAQLPAPSFHKRSKEKQRIANAI